jgi:hypothetical protein
MGYAYVCIGKKCARACDHDQLVRALCKVSTVQAVRCQKVCHGSVVGAVLDDEVRWFERVDSPHVCVALKKAVKRGSRRNLPKSLRKRRIKRLTGCLPR